MEKKLITIIKELTQSKYIGDDCAVIELGNEKFLFSQDNFVENIHFSSDYFSPADIGWKSLAVNISDIAAMAGQPLFFSVGIALNKDITDKETWIKEFYQGINDCSQKFGQAQVIGGDITASNAGTMISISIIGRAGKTVFYRNGAQPGFKVCVSGEFGGSANYLNSALEDKAQHPQRLKHLRPEPQLEKAQEILKTTDIGALMDASDGLAEALWEISQQSGENIFIDVNKIPRDPNISLSEALYGGEDYQLVGTFPNVPKGFTLIGEVKNSGKTPNLEPKVIEADSNEILTKAKIFDHFS